MGLVRWEVVLVLAQGMFGQLAWATPQSKPMDRPIQVGDRFDFRMQGSAYLFGNSKEVYPEVLFQMGPDPSGKDAVLGAPSIYLKTVKNYPPYPHLPFCVMRFPRDSMPPEGQPRLIDFGKMSRELSWTSYSGRSGRLVLGLGREVRPKPKDSPTDLICVDPDNRQKVWNKNEVEEMLNRMASLKPKLNELKPAIPAVITQPVELNPACKTCKESSPPKFDDNMSRVTLQPAAPYEGKALKVIQFRIKGILEMEKKVRESSEFQEIDKKMVGFKRRINDLGAMQYSHKGLNAQEADELNQLLIQRSFLSAEGEKLFEPATLKINELFEEHPGHEDEIAELLLYSA